VAILRYVDGILRYRYYTAILRVNINLEITQECKPQSGRHFDFFGPSSYEFLLLLAFLLLSGFQFTETFSISQPIVIKLQLYRLVKVFPIFVPTNQ